MNNRFTKPVYLHHKSNVHTIRTVYSVQCNNTFHTTTSPCSTPDQCSRQPHSGFKWTSTVHIWTRTSWQRQNKRSQ